jgi:hypothetical protein
MAASPQPVGRSRWTYRFQERKRVSPLIARDDSFLKFDGGIGVIPVSNVAVANGVTTVSRNVVRGINSPGQIWTIAALKANVDTDGRIQVRGRGLLLAGGNGIGTNAGQSVLATLFCGAASVLSTTTTPVPLEANGDFRIDDQLTPVPANPCDNPVLLIRNGTGTVWFAAGILKLDDKN